MEAELEKQFLAVHNNLVRKYNNVKFDVQIFRKLSTNLLNEIKEYAIYNDDDNKKILDGYCSYMDALFNMLEKTTNYVGEMMTKIQVTQNLLNVNSDCSSPFTLLDASNSESESRLLTYSSTVTSIEANANDNLTRPPKLKSNETSETSDVVLPLNKLLNEPKKHENKTNTHETFLANIDKANVIINRPKTIPCGTLDISTIKIGSIILNATVCSVDKNGLEFCICFLDSPEFQLLKVLYKKLDRIVYKCYPEPGTIFGIKLEDGIVRAVRCLPPSENKVYLPDYGDIEELDKDMNNIFQLSDDEQNITGQAIFCKLYNATKSVSEPASQYELLHSILYKPKQFKVHDIINGVLHLAIHEDTNEKQNAVKSKRGTQLTAEEIELLNEEPTCSSNALKAVLGYIPKDDQKICRFYDPKTETCFKGNNCKQLHIPMLDDYFTKDTTPSNAFLQNSTMPEVCYEPNTLLTIFVTHIRSLEYFFGIIVDPEKEPKPLVWSDDEIQKCDLYKSLPLPFDIVLARFVQDDNWYRAEVIDVDNPCGLIHVLYIDYGNRQYVSLKNIAKCDDVTARIPRMAQLFRIANMHTIALDRQLIEKGEQFLLEILANQNVQICIVSHHEDIFVRFLNEPYSHVPKILEDMKCVKIVKMF